MIAAAMAALTGTALHAQTLPLKELPGIDERDHWLPDEVNQDGALEALQNSTAEAAQPFTGELEKPLQIALIYPSADTSDFWARNYLAREFPLLFASQVIGVVVEKRSSGVGLVNRSSATLGITTFEKPGNTSPGMSAISPFGKGPAKRASE